MKKYFVIALVACVALVTLAATPAHAQSLIRVDVPFSFSASSELLPAGEYTINRIGFHSALTLYSDQRGVEMILPLTVESRSDFEVPKLVFHRYGDEYFLAEIWTTNDTAVRTLAAHPRERQLAKTGVSPQVAVVYGAMSATAGK